MEYSYLETLNDIDDNTPVSELKRVQLARDIELKEAMIKAAKIDSKIKQEQASYPVSIGVQADINVLLFLCHSVRTSMIGSATATFGIRGDVFSTGITASGILLPAPATCCAEGEPVGAFACGMYFGAILYNRRYLSLSAIGYPKYAFQPLHKFLILASLKANIKVHKIIDLFGEITTHVFSAGRDSASRNVVFFLFTDSYVSLGLGLNINLSPTGLANVIKTTVSVADIGTRIADIGTRRDH